MNTAIVPFEQLERMAVAVAKSGLFGMKTTEQALGLMLLAQAEQIHPMVAVRDYHIIDGRPALKAETILARFQAAGGSVEWHCMTDEKCDATFVHPNAPKPVRIDWTIERATRATLSGKSNWRGYPRQMLRARTIAEGVRATYPAVLAGKYAPEELSEAAPLDSEQATPVTLSRAGLVDDVADGHMSAIGIAPSLDTLKRAYAEAYRAARDADDELRMRSFQVAYEARKGELTNEGAAP